MCGSLNTSCAGSESTRVRNRPRMRAVSMLNIFDHQKCTLGKKKQRACESFFFQQSEQGWGTTNVGRPHFQGLRLFLERRSWFASPTLVALSGYNLLVLLHGSLASLRTQLRLLLTDAVPNPLLLFRLSVHVLVFLCCCSAVAAARATHVVMV